MKYKSLSTCPPLSKLPRLKTGFTLIELLVVVLIIGILAAIAIPQYQAAVLKTRFHTVIANINAFKTALEVYHLQHGNYPDDDISEVDFDMSGCTKISAGQITCGKFFYDYDGTSTGSANAVIGYYNNNNATHSADWRIAYKYFLSHNSPYYSGLRRCEIKDANDKIAARICSSMSTKKISEKVWEMK